MLCQWDAYVKILPVWLRAEVDRFFPLGLREIRLRLGRNPEAVIQDGSVWLERRTSQEDIQYCINSATQYSPWNSGTICSGFITAPGGHRIGICGDAVMDNGKVINLRKITSLCIRVCRDVVGIASSLSSDNDSVLIIGKPGTGKTTLLRDLIRCRSDIGKQKISVVDERREIFPLTSSGLAFHPGKRVDVLSGCGKAQGITAVLRSMTPDTIAVDEITDQEDCEALIHTAWCGVKLLATAHAASRKELQNRTVYKPLLSSRIFQTLIVLHDDQTWHREALTS